MPRLTLRLRITALVLAATISIPWTAAAAPTARHQTAGPGLLQQLWTALTGFWVSGVIPDDGCRMDPNGRCATGSAVSAPVITPDDGCQWDPSGRCGKGSAVPAPPITPDSGCRWDPNGVCLPG
jgi:hypothetical protein